MNTFNFCNPNSVSTLTVSSFLNGQIDSCILLIKPRFLHFDRQVTKKTVKYYFAKIAELNQSDATKAKLRHIVICTVRQTRAQRLYKAKQRRHK